MSIRLASVSVHGVPGLPDLEVTLQPVTAVIGPRASGKSRLLMAIEWLLTGSSRFDHSFAGAIVSADLVDEAGATKRVTRGLSTTPGDGAALPAVLFLPARARVPAPSDAPIGSRSDAAAAEQMIEMIAQRRLGGTVGEVLLIEEPELMLTPQQQRHLNRLLRRYAELNQVVFSTRAPALLDADNYHEIVRLDRTSAGTRVRRARPELLTDFERLRLQAEFDHERTEMFFASAVLLVEGQTERQSMPVIFRRLGHDPDALGISIVEVGGKGNFGIVAQVLAELGIPHVIVHDQDRGRQSAMENREIRRQAGEAPVFMLRPDFEGVAGIRHYEDKVFDAWQRFSTIDPRKIPATFKRIVEVTVRLAQGEPA